MSDALRTNAQVLMRLRRVSPSQLARRMDALGFAGWSHAKTGLRFVNPKGSDRRHISVDELVGLAIALDTTVDVLLGGNLTEAHGYRVGGLDLPPGKMRVRIFDDESSADPERFAPNSVRWGVDDKPTPPSGPDKGAREQIMGVLLEIGGATPSEVESMTVAEILARLLLVLDPDHALEDSPLTMKEAKAEAALIQDLRARLEEHERRMADGSQGEG